MKPSWQRKKPSQNAIDDLIFYSLTISLFIYRWMMAEKVRVDALAGAIQEPKDLLTEFQTNLIASGREETTIDRYLQTTKTYLNMRARGDVRIKSSIRRGN